MRPLPEELWAVDVAALYNVKLRSIQRWCQKGQVPARRIGRLWLVKVGLLRDRNPDLYEELAERWERRERKLARASIASQAT